ncbi:S8 family serine peptidase [Shewanella sp. WXL01]|uniref:S8 family serine peptidase n=1 Tax=Shewanella sp. WXL01 TaxID=2709721 RepID=UPI0014386BF6|nr:S8 family serine peptidase [Shewanella sp. WXL01]NKF49897.1 S8 family serine peptidase [Shewanella sp. WXL01]
MNKSKLWLALSVAMLTGASAQAAPVKSNVQKTFLAGHKNHVGISGKITNAEKQTYIIELKDDAVSSFQGNDKFAGTKQLLKQGVKTKAAPQIQQYKQHLQSRQNSALASIAKATSLSVSPTVRYHFAMNGFALELSKKQAQRIAQLAEVKAVYPEQIHQLNTDVGPQHIGADKIWESAVPELAGKGEGVLLGIIDSGINTDNISFAEVGGDGYVHTNPYGDGVFVGDCETDASLCNNKLIGVYSFPEVTDNYAGLAAPVGEDYNGHGSHTSGTAGGNVLADQPILKQDNTNQGDGTPIGDAKFARLSGVAPHANIISYQTCNEEGSCFDSLTVKAVDLAIEHGVDVINFSIGPGGDGGSPWTSASGMAFLKAREAGIFVAAAAGNAGPGESTVGNVAPWTTVVANYTHSRIFTKSFTGTNDEGVDLATIEGVGGLSDEVTAGVVYAGDLGDGSIDYSLCDFTFYDDLPEIQDKILICDRGDIALYDKSVNAQDKGAVGVLIRNVPQSGSDMYNIPYAIPGMLLTEESGEELMNWVASSTNPTLTIAQGEVGYSDLMANSANASSSRGPSLYAAENMVPHIAAPGTDIYAAYSDDQPFAWEPGTADFAFLTGTSMASPHVAGAAALFTQVHPDATPAQIQSALMLTANSETTIQDLATPSQVWDHGSGMTQVDLAVKAGLWMDETIDNYVAANPEVGGTPKELNGAYFVDSNCKGECEFTRAFTATQAGNWSLAYTGASELDVTISPTSAVLAEGESLEVTVSIKVADNAGDSWNYGRLKLTDSTGASPELSLPIAIQPMVADIADWNTVEVFHGNASIENNDYAFRRPLAVSATSDGLMPSESFHFSLAGDTDNRSPVDDLTDGVKVVTVNVGDDVEELVAIIGKTKSYDADIYIGWDNNNNGTIEEVEFICAGNYADLAQFEVCSIDNPAPGQYWVMTHNWLSEADGSIDDFRVDVIQRREADMIPIDITVDSSVEPYSTMPLTIEWASKLANKAYYTAIDFTENNDGVEMELGQSIVVFDHTRNALNVSTDASSVTSGQEVAYSVVIPEGAASADQPMQVELKLSEKMQWLDSEQGSVSGQTLTFEATQGGEFVAKAQVLANQSGDMSTAWSYSVEGTSVTDSGAVALSNPNSRPDAKVKVASMSADEGTSVTLSAQMSEDADNDALSFTWTQVEGTKATISSADSAEATVSLPNVSGNETLVFEVTVSDGELSETETVKVDVINQDDGGSLGALWLSILAMLGLRRRAKA